MWITIAPIDNGPEYLLREESIFAVKSVYSEEGKGGAYLALVLDTIGNETLTTSLFDDMAVMLRGWLSLTGQDELPMLVNPWNLKKVFGNSGPPTVLVTAYRDTELNVLEDYATVKGLLSPSMPGTDGSGNSS